NENIIVSNPPANQTVCPGDNASFSVSVTGTGLSYQWFKGDVSLGQTGSTLTLNGVSAVDAGTYSVVITGTCGAPVTNSATLSVNENIIVSNPPANQTVCPGDNASFSVSASGSSLS